MKYVEILTFSLIAFFFLSCEGKDLGQSSAEFSYLLTDDKNWIEVMIPNSSPSTLIVDSLILEGDSILKGVTYSKVKRYRKSVNEDLPVVYEASTIVLMRETDDGKIYVKDELYYDFNLEVGDTIWNDTSHGCWKVSNVDTVSLCGVTRKRISLKSRCSSDTMFWIEGIGSSMGLLYGGSCAVLNSESLGVQAIGGSFMNRLEKVLEDGQIIYEYQGN